MCRKTGFQFIAAKENTKILNSFYSGITSRDGCSLHFPKNLVSGSLSGILVASPPQMKA
jgi:hypothetical protein